MKKILLTCAILLGLSTLEAHALKPVSDVIVGSATVMNIQLGVATVQLDTTQVNERIKFEVCTNTTTTIFCGYSAAISSAAVNGIQGRPITNGCWEKNLSTMITIWCALGLDEGADPGTVNVTLTQEGNGRN